MTKQIKIDWDIRTMVKGKCTGVGCPIRATCERFTAKEFEKEYGYISPPHGNDGHFPQKCINFLNNAPHKPAMKTFDTSGY